MKTAIYIEDGVVQLVITPESDFEKSALRSFEDKPMEAKVFAGTFYDCRGGWVRQASHHFDLSAFGSSNNNDRSLILRMTAANSVNSYSTTSTTSARDPHALGASSDAHLPASKPDQETMSSSDNDLAQICAKAADIDQESQINHLHETSARGAVRAA
jgi:hypothetical protein